MASHLIEAMETAQRPPLKNRLALDVLADQPDPLNYWIALAMINARPPTTETAMNVPAAKSQISVFV
jgi:hypothetical protein